MRIKQIVKTDDLSKVKKSALVNPRLSRHISSDELLDGKPEVEIAHDGDTYRLRLTTYGKLILSK